MLLGYQKARINDLPQPRGRHPRTGWHAHHARVAIGDGGLLGTGFGKGTQNLFGFIPDQYTDFPFPVFAEEWGFVGCVVLICLYGFLTRVVDPRRLPGQGPLRRRARGGQRAPSSSGTP